MHFLDTAHALNPNREKKCLQNTQLQDKLLNYHVNLYGKQNVF